jgi:hypothetical protein
VKTYADTSFLFSLYAADTNSVRADAWRKANPAPLPFTTFHRLELRNAPKTCGMPERFAQEALGHNSNAVHRAYAKQALMKIPSLEDYEQLAAAKVETAARTLL